MYEERSRIEKELRFLRESLDSDVISKSEYDRERKRLEAKLKEIENEQDKRGKAGDGREVPIEDGPDERDEGPEDDNAFEDEAEEKGIRDEKEEEVDGIINGKGNKQGTEIRGGAKQHGSADADDHEGSESAINAAGSVARTADIKKGHDKEKVGIKTDEVEVKEAEGQGNKKDESGEKEVQLTRREEEERTENVEERKKEGNARKIFLTIIVIAMLAFVYYQYYSNEARGEEDPPQNPLQGYEEDIIIPDKASEIPSDSGVACSEDSDCESSEVVLVCANPGTQESVCVPEEVDPVSELTIINSDSCKECSTERMENVLRQLFPNIEINRADIESAEGAKMAEGLSIAALPAYIFSKEVAEARNFERFSQALAARGDYYAVKPSASGAGFFYTRNRAPATIDVYLEYGDDTTPRNLEELSTLFGSQISINYHRHLSVKDIEDKGLFITSLPTFVINNRLKVIGVLSAEAIKESFCGLNPLPECATTLSEYIRE